MLFSVVKGGTTLEVQSVQTTSGNGHSASSSLLITQEACHSQIICSPMAAMIHGRPSGGI